jgi:rubrerythrin
MPEFANPFAGNIPKEMSAPELAAALRLDIAGELEAIHLYRAHAAATNDSLVKQQLLDIADEEVAHCGELLALVRYLDPSVGDKLASGEREVLERMEKLGIDPARINATIAPLAPTQE